MYSSKPAIVYGFHGLDQTIGIEILNQKQEFRHAAFIEGQQLYDGAKFYSQNHIQLAIINPDCIKGIFLPRAKFDKP
jgi:hypothetical protein